MCAHHPEYRGRVTGPARLPLQRMTDECVVVTSEETPVDGGLPGGQTAVRNTLAI